MRSESGLANIDVFGTQRAIGQPDPSVYIPKHGDITRARQEAQSSPGTGELDRPREEPGIEFAEEVGFAAKLHELLKERDVATPEVHSEWRMTIDVLPDALAQDEARQEHESVRSHIEALSRIDPSELSDGAVPPTSESRDAAISAVDALFHGRGLIFQHVSPLPDGGIELELESRQLYIGLWIYDRDNIEVLVQRGSEEHSQKVRIDQLSDVIWEQLV